jgi:hypothetical protein
MAAGMCGGSTKTGIEKSENLNFVFVILLLFKKFGSVY